jgi:hypothetical protein
MTHTSGMVLTEKKDDKKLWIFFYTVRMYFNKHTRDFVEF